MVENVSERWAKRRERLLVARILEAGLDFSSVNIKKIVGEMSYEIQKEKNPGDCPCYSSHPCHVDVENLNCFVCGCPNYDSILKDEIGFIGGCKIKSKKGKYLENSSPGKDGFGEKVWDCSTCAFQHTLLFSEQYLIMNLRHYSELAECLKRERVERGFSDFKSFADFLSEEIIKGY